MNFIDGKKFSNLTEYSRSFIDAAMHDQGMMIDMLHGDVFEDREIEVYFRSVDAEHLETHLIKSDFTFSGKDDIYVELVACFYPCYDIRSKKNSHFIPFFGVDEYDIPAFEQPFTVFFDKEPKAYLLKRSLFAEEMVQLKKCSDLVGVASTEIFSVEIYIISNTYGEVLI